MSNKNGNKDSLVSYPPHWYSQPTQTIRVPVELADAILDFSHQLDEALAQIDASEGAITHYVISGDLKGLERASFTK